jgi:hypothetical protein
MHHVVQNVVGVRDDFDTESEYCVMMLKGCLKRPKMPLARGQGARRVFIEALFLLSVCPMIRFKSVHTKSVE